MKPFQVNYVIYHHPCLDGFSSALVAKRYFDENHTNENIIYQPMGHGSSFLPDDIDGKNVLVCDFSFPPMQTKSLISRANKVLVIDHHKSAEKDLAEIEEQYKIFDMNHSGAVLTWKYFYPNTETPQFLLYIEDHDIWRKSLPFTDEFNSYVKTLPLEFDAFKDFLNRNDGDYCTKQAIKAGTSFNVLNKFYAKEAAKWVVPKFSKIGKRFYMIGYTNTTILKSEIGNDALQAFPNIDLAAVYSLNDKNDYTVFSLRSEDTKMDVSKLARYLGGGGHRNASAVGIEHITSTLPGTVYDRGEIYELLGAIYFQTMKLTVDNIPVTLNIVYLQSQNNKRRLGSYLLQTKYKSSHIRTQVACCIHSPDPNSPSEKPSYVHASAVWFFDALKSSTTFVVTIDKKLDVKIRDALFTYFEKNKSLTIEERTKDVLILKIPGMYDSF